MMSVFVFVNLQSKYVDEDRWSNVVPDKECGNSPYLDVIPKRVKVSVNKICKKKVCAFNIRDVRKRFFTTGIITFRAFRPKVLKLENTWARYVQFGELIV